VVGFKYEPNTLLGRPYSKDVSDADAKFCAHVTVADGSIVSIENIGPEPGWSSRRKSNGWLFNSSGKELDAYTWGTIPDIFDKIGSIYMKEASDRYGYSRKITYDKKYGFPDSLDIEIHTINPSPFYSDFYPQLSPAIEMLKGNTLYKALLYIKNFKVTEKAP